MLKLTHAEQAVTEAKTYAQNLNCSVSVAVLDSTNTLVQFERMEEAAPVTADAAYSKARSAILHQSSTKAIQEKFQENLLMGVSVLQLNGSGFLSGGGIPIMYEEQVAGAVGISGASIDQDHEICTSAVTAIDI